MEITLDIGEDLYDLIESVSAEKDKKMSVIAAEMLSTGARIFASSEEGSEDKLTKDLLENTLKSKEILVEVLSMVFDKSKSKIGAYDAETTISIIDRMVDSYTKGAY